MLKLRTINKTYAVLAVFALLIAVFYGNTLVNGFVLDDQILIQDNPSLESIRTLPTLLGGCPAQSPSNECDGKFYYRPIHHVWNFTWYQISSQPWIFHLVHLVLFWGAVVLTFVFVRMLTKNYLLAFLTALMFLIHPRNSDTR